MTVKILNFTKGGKVTQKVAPLRKNHQITKSDIYGREIGRGERAIFIIREIGDSIEALLGTKKGGEFKGRKLSQ